MLCCILRAFGLDLPTTAVFDYPTPLALAGFIANEMKQSAGDSNQIAASYNIQLNAEAANVMVIDACAQRLSAEAPSARGDGFSMDVVPFSRWDRDLSKASQRLGATFARYFCRFCQGTSASFKRHSLYGTEKSSVAELGMRRNAVCLG